MALLPIITAPDPRLKVRSESVEQIDDELRTFMDDMLETMYDAPGVGLSASVAALGMFRPDDVDLSEVAQNVPTAQQIFNQVGWK